MIAKKSFSNILTAGKDYHVIRKVGDNIVVIDDQGDEIGFNKMYFEKEILAYDVRFLPSQHEPKEHTKSELIQAYLEGWHDDIPFIDMEKWYNEKFGKNDNSGK